MKKIVFLSMPYRAESIRGIVENIRRAEACSLELWKRGYFVICPHMNTALFDGALPDEVWLEGDMMILNRCDSIVMGQGWETSSGAKAELKFAEEEGIEVLYYDTIIS